MLSIVQGGDSSYRGGVGAERGKKSQYGLL